MLKSLPAILWKTAAVGRDVYQAIRVMQGMLDNTTGTHNDPGTYAKLRHAAGIWSAAC